MTPFTTRERRLNTIFSYKLLFPTLAFLFLSFYGSAQTSHTICPNLEKITNNNNKEESLFKDEGNQIYYIDFEFIDVNLKEVVLKNAEGKILIEESVTHLPVDTIFELDCSQYEKGYYTIELHSYTSIFKQPLSL